MGLYNFQARFVPFIKAGTKKHTIRAKRARPDKPGNTLHLYQGLRTKKTKLILRAPCVKVEEITIVKSGDLWPQYTVRIDGMMLDRSECEALARRDGFSNFQEMMKFWTEPSNRLPFEGHIIHWK